MTWNSFKAYYEQEAHGWYPPEKLREKWAAVQQEQNCQPVDTKGVVGGVSGHPRFRVELEDSDDSLWMPSNPCELLTQATPLPKLDR